SSFVIAYSARCAALMLRAAATLPSLPRIAISKVSPSMVPSSSVCEPAAPNVTRSDWTTTSDAVSSSPATARWYFTSRLRLGAPAVPWPPEPASTSKTSGASLRTSVVFIGTSVCSRAGEPWARTALPSVQGRATRTPPAAGRPPRCEAREMGVGGLEETLLLPARGWQEVHMVRRWQPARAEADSARGRVRALRLGAIGRRRSGVYDGLNAPGHTPCNRACTSSSTDTEVHASTR